MAAVLSAGAASAQEAPEPPIPPQASPQDLSLKRGEDGVAVVRCRVSEQRFYTGCVVLGENPEGENFGPAAIQIVEGESSTGIVLQNRVRPPDSVPIGATVQFRVPFHLE